MSAYREMRASDEAWRVNEAVPTFHGTADNFIQCGEGSKVWNIECLVTEVCDVRTLEGRPKLFFIEACRGRER